MGALDFLKAVLESIPGGHIEHWLTLRPDKEKVIKRLSEEEISLHEELSDMESEMRVSLTTIRLTNSHL